MSAPDSAAQAAAALHLHASVIGNLQISQLDGRAVIGRCQTSAVASSTTETLPKQRAVHRVVHFIYQCLVSVHACRAAAINMQAVRSTCSKSMGELLLKGWIMSSDCCEACQVCHEVSRR